MAVIHPWIERDFKIAPFLKIAEEMKAWGSTPNHQPQLWFGEHHLVVTKGLRAHDDVVDYWPNVKTNRGGQLTVHGPGQLVFYPLWDMIPIISIPRYRWLLEETARETIAQLHPSLELLRKEDSPGLFSIKGKIAALGLRVYRQSVYHGISLNLTCSLTPFHSIICCGDPAQKATSLKDCGFFSPLSHVKKLMKKNFYRLIDLEVAHVLHDTSSR